MYCIATCPFNTHGVQIGRRHSRLWFGIANNNVQQD